MKQIPTLLIVLLTQAIYITQVHAQQTFSPTQLRKLDSIATQDVPPAAPGIATAIIQNGKLAYQKVAGFASLPDSVLISPHSRFNIASNAKQFTALALLLLESRQKLRLTDDLRKYLPQLFTGIRQPITIQHLLTHTSGIRDVYDLWALQGITWWKNSFSNSDAMALLAAQQDLNFTPGSSYLYSNSNYILLAQIIEKVSAQPFAVFMNQLFQQLRMPNTAFEPDFSRIRGPIARAYFNFNTWTTYEWKWNVCGDGNLFTTLGDQVQWERLVQGSGSTAIDRRLISKSQQLVSAGLTKQYGYGLEFGGYKGFEYCFHEGATGAWKATVIRFPGKKISMITLTNTGKSIPASQTRQMADLVLGLKSDAAFFATKPAKAGNYVSEGEVVGTYFTANNFTFEFIQKENELYLRRNGRNDIKLQREAANIFHQANDSDFKQEFTQNRAGEMQVTAYYTSHAPYTLTRPLADWTKVDFAALNGTYLNPETQVTLRLAYLKDRTYAVTLSGSSNVNEGRLVLPGKMLAGNYTITVEKNAGSVLLLLDGDRIKRVRFNSQ